MDNIKLLFAKNVFSGKISIESVPEILREDVQKLVDKMKEEKSVTSTEL